MRKQTALDHFHSQTAIAKALGITKSAVSQWKDVIPERMAYRLERATRRKLRVDRSLYESSDGNAAA
jgi:predicted transcriptional regulator